MKKLDFNHNLFYYYLILIFIKGELWNIVKYYSRERKKSTKN